MNTDDPWPDLEEAEYRVLVMQKKLHRWYWDHPYQRHEHVESRMRWKSHVRFGGRARETHQPKGWQGALVRPLHRDPH